MASLRKRLSKWALGGGDEQIKRPLSMDLPRVSLDSGYHSMTQKGSSQIPSLLPEQDSPQASRKTLHKALSTTFDYLADTVRQGAASFHQQSLEKDDYLSEHSEVETPKQTPEKHRRRSSVFSSVRSRKAMFSPKSRKAGLAFSDAPEPPPTPTRVTDEKAPILDVSIPSSPHMHNDSPKGITRSDTVCGTITLWPSPAEVAVGLEDPYIDQDDLSIRVRSFVASTWAASPSAKPDVPTVDDKGYAADIETGAEQSESEAFTPPSYQPMVSRLSEVSDVPANSQRQETPRARVDDQSGSPRRPLIPPRGSSNARLKSATVPQLTSDLPGSKHCTDRSASDVYEADAECSETSPRAIPSMGSRIKFELVRADRDRRYLAAMVDNVHSVGDSPAQVELPKSPEASPKSEAIGERIPRAPSPKGAFRYDVEAAEKRSGMELSEEQDKVSSLSEEQLASCLLSMGFGIDDAMAFGIDKGPNFDGLLVSDSETEISENSPSQNPQYPQPEDAYDAGMRAAGLSGRSYSRLPPSALSQSLGMSTSVNPARSSIPVGHSRSASNLSDVTDDSCAVTTSSLSCDAPPPFPSLHVRSEAADPTLTDLDAFHNAEKEDIPLTGPANTGFKILSPGGAALKSAGEDAVSAMPDDHLFYAVSFAVFEDNIASQKVELQETTPQKVFTAARLPDFGSPCSPCSSGSSTRSRRTIRPKKKTRGRPPFTEMTGNAIKRETGPLKVHPSQFRVKHFKSLSGDSSSYAGHELDPVSFAAPPSQEDVIPSPQSDKKAVCFAKDVEIIGHDGGLGRDSMDAEDLNDGRVIKRDVDRELEEKRDLALTRLMRRLTSGDLREQVREKENIEELFKADKPRWRVPSKVTDALT